MTQCHRPCNRSLLRHGVWEGLEERAEHQPQAPPGTVCLTVLQQRVSLGFAHPQQPRPPQRSDTVEEKLSVSSWLALVTTKKSLCRPWRGVLSAMSIHWSRTGNPLTSLGKYRIVSNTTEMLAARIETDCVSMWKSKCSEIFIHYMESFGLNQVPMRHSFHIPRFPKANVQFPSEGSS